MCRLTSDNSSGECSFSNKRGFWRLQMPGTAMIRRSDDVLIYNCKTSDGRQTNGAVASETEGEKMAASIIFWDFGITDAITDKHRKYPASVIIPVASTAKSEE